MRPNATTDRTPSVPLVMAERVRARVNVGRQRTLRGLQRRDGFVGGGEGQEAADQLAAEALSILLLVSSIKY